MPHEILLRNLRELYSLQVPTATWPPLGRRFGEVSRSRRF
ncbi:hypothetical protein L837_3148 [Mycobacterium avium MAV_061107_1842]|uniref:Uncharacterized protein n=1 Tax=Mycobacterium avium (strain 104) TaxID=243243 RepID=A0A0H2ZV75_MYCA1|nr:hypothetical protein MAV_0968 [Mycobacterium avium 104]ETZ46627.1 hypothetical protein L837_3148 [Mycobacterium avium MAV_061107_1842]